jgi:hypothetical protein
MLACTDKGRARATLALAAAALLGASPFATAAVAEPLKRISVGNPFAGCTADDVPAQEAEGSKAWINAEVEPYVDNDPKHPRTMVAVWQQDRWSDGGSRGLLSATSKDGGTTWQTVTPPPFTLCTGGIFERATDPWVSFGPDGAAYFMSLSFDSDPAIFGGHHAIQVSKSTDGGLHWGAPVTLLEENLPDAFNDKESITADPTNAKLVYGIWDRLENFVLNEDQAAALAASVRHEHDKIVMAGRKLRQMQSAAAAAPAAALVPSFKGPTYFTRSTDGGTTWDLAHIIYDPGADNQTIGNIIQVLPSGELIAVFSELLNTNQGFVAFISLKRSTDQGFTFRPNRPIRAQQILSNGVFFSTGIITPNKHLGVRDASLLFDPAVDPKTGALYLVWQDGRFNGVDQVAFSQSTDGGRTWSAPIKVNQTPPAPNLLRTQAFVPAVTVNSDGVIAVTYYDFRNDGQAGELTDEWVVFCDPDQGSCAQADQWKAERRVTPTSFDITKAPLASDPFLGDYQGLAAPGRAVLPVFAAVDGQHKTSIYSRRIAPPSPLISSRAQ